MDLDINSKKQLIRFFFVSVINTIFGYSVYSFFIYLGFHYALAVLGSTVIGILFNFQTIGRIVFGTAKSKVLIKFIAVYVFTYNTNVFFIWLLVAASLDKYLAGLITIIPIGLLSFFLNKRFVFLPHEDEKAR